MFSNGVKIQLTHTFEEIICLENILEAWKEFKKGKKQRKDAQIFQMRLMDNIFQLTTNFLIIPTNTADIKLLKSMIQNPETFTRRQSATDYCTMLFTKFFIRFLKRLLSSIHIHAS